MGLQIDNETLVTVDGSASISFQTFCWSLILINCCSFLLNSVMMTILWKNGDRLLRHGANRILLSLVLSDILVSLFGTSLGVLLLTGQSQQLYKLAGTVPMFGSMFVSIGSLALLTGDRLASIKRPFQYGQAPYLRAVTRVVILLWLIPVLVTGIHVLIFLYTSSNFELKLRSGLTVVFFIAVAMVLVVSNAFLVASLRKQSRVFSELRTRTLGADRLEKQKASQGEAVCQGDAVCQGEAVCQGGQSSVANLQHDDSHDVVNLVPTGPMPTKEKEQKSSAKSPNVSVFKCQTLQKEASEIETNNKLQLQQTALRKTEERISKICIFVVSLFVFCWAPLVTYRLAYFVGSTFSLPWFRRLALCLAASNSLLNPCVYLLLRRDFRKLLKKTFRLQYFESL